MKTAVYLSVSRTGAVNAYARKSVVLYCEYFGSYHPDVNVDGFGRGVPVQQHVAYSPAHRTRVLGGLPSLGYRSPPHVYLHGRAGLPPSDATV